MIFTSWPSIKMSVINSDHIHIPVSCFLFYVSNSKKYSVQVFNLEIFKYAEEKLLSSHITDFHKI